MKNFHQNVELTFQNEKYDQKLLRLGWRKKEKRERNESFYFFTRKSEGLNPPTLP